MAIFLLLVLALSFSLPAQANPPRKTVVLLASDLTVSEILPGGKLDPVRQLAAEGGIALLNTAVSGQPTEAAAYLSVGASERMAAPGTGGPLLLEGGIERSIADIATEAYGIRRPEGVPVSQGYRRRFGEYPPLRAAIVHLGVPSLRTAQPSESRAAQIGLLGTAFHQAGRTVAAYGDWRAALVAMDTRGAVWEGSIPTELGPKQIAPILAKADVIIISVDSPRMLRILTRAVLPLARRKVADVLIASVAPPLNESGNRWESLGFLVAAGPSFPIHSLLTSSTTRTAGLVANIDIAPTIATLQGITLAGAGGHPIQATVVADPLPCVIALDQQVDVLSNASVPIMLAYGIFAIVTALLAGLAIAFHRPLLADATRFGLLVAAAALPAMLALSLYIPFRVRDYALAFVGVSLLLALVFELIGRLTQRSGLGWLLTATAVTIIIDALFGSPLVSRSLISAYYLAGIRYYGIGNEYMGVLVGAALVGPALLAHKVTSRRYRILSGLLYGGALLALAVPAWGADAGGALAAAVAFVLALLAQRTDRLRGRHLALAFGVAFCLVGLIALADRLEPDAARTHIGAAVATGQAHGMGALVEIAARKIAMNARLTVSPYTVAAAVWLVPLWLFLARGRLGEQARASLSTRTPLARVMAPAIWGAFAAFVFNDSGIVAALLLLAPVTVAVIESMVCDISP